MVAAEIEVALARIDAALGDALASNTNPTGAFAYYDEGHEQPWRISDDYVTERYDTAQEAEVAAADWNGD